MTWNFTSTISYYCSTHDIFKYSRPHCVSELIICQVSTPEDPHHSILDEEDRRAMKITNQTLELIVQNFNESRKERREVPE